MIRLLLDPPRFECETADEAAVLARLLGIRTTEHVAIAAPIQTLPTKTAPRPVSKFAGRGPMQPTGHSKPCKKCGAEFPVLDRTDCPSVYCRACRPAPPKPRKPRLPVPAAMKATHVRKHADPVSCSRCGASVPEFESINGECLQCAPMGARKSA